MELSGYMQITVQLGSKNPECPTYAYDQFGHSYVTLRGPYAEYCEHVRNTVGDQSSWIYHPERNIDDLPQPVIDRLLALGAIREA